MPILKNPLHTSCCIAVLLSCLAFQAAAQEKDTLSTVHLSGVTVTAFKNEPASETSLNIAPLLIDSLSATGNYNLCDLMAKTPGVTMLSTGPAITKPVIRGLYGNRVLVLMNGLKFDNQQWQEEHGLGLSDMGLSRVELVKGPMSVLYGSEAMGGIVNLIDEEKPAAGTSICDASIKFNSNTMGGMLQGGVRRNYGNHWFRVRIGVENNADYTDGNNHRVLNSRFDGYSAKASMGFIRKNWVSNNHYAFSYNRFGFIFNDIYDFVLPDNRWSRSLADNPAHFVILHILSSENTLQLPYSKLSINAGFQSNQRMENEGGGKISLNMQLLTFQYLLKYERKLNDENRLIVSHLGSVEQNTNFGARKIVPNAQMLEGNVSVYLESDLHEKWNLENGIGAGDKHITTTKTNGVNTPDKDIQPFSKNAVYTNFFSGLSYVPTAAFNLKFNIATGVRIPNLAELSSNGLHEGVFTYEIGDPHLKNEQNLSINLVADIHHDSWSFNISPFFNRFFNYVYLAPTSEQWSGFPVYRYKQQDATQFGAEAMLTVKAGNNFTVTSAASAMQSKTADGHFTPYTPAAKWSPGVHYQLKRGDRRMYAAYVSGDYCFAQHDLAPEELGTGDYFLLNAGIRKEFKCKSTTWAIGLAGNNLLNRTYFDHLSRFKYFGIQNMGRNLCLHIQLTFGSVAHP